MATPYTKGSESINQAEHISPEKTGDNIDAKRSANYVWNGSSWQRMTQPGESAIYITIIRANSGDPDISYIGKAAPGSSTSSAVWQIAKLDENTNLDLTYADSGAFTQIYDNREGLTYA